MDAAGFTGIDIGGQIIGTNLLTVQEHICGGTQNLYPICNTLGLHLFRLFLGQRIVILPGCKQGAANKGLDPVLAIVIGVIQTHTEILTVGELKDINKGIIIGGRRLILCNRSHIIDIQLAVQPGILTGSRQFAEGAIVLIGNIPNACGPMEGRTCHIHRQLAGHTEVKGHDCTVGDPCFHSQLSGSRSVVLSKQFDHIQRFVQPNRHMPSLAHDAQFNAAAALILCNLRTGQRMNTLPVGSRLFTGELCILQNILILFLQDINMPGLAVAELDPHTASLL